jgi:hypothetical protein
LQEALGTDYHGCDHHTASAFQGFGLPLGKPDCYTYNSHINGVAPRGAARGFHPCEYCKTNFGTANARRLHELYSLTCVRLLVHAEASGQSSRQAPLMYGQYAFANGQEVAGHESDGFPMPPSPGGLHGPQSPAGERANEPPEKPAPAISPKAPQDPGKRPVPPSSPCFNQRNEMQLALQTAGRNGKSISPAGLKRLFRVFHQPGFSFEKFLKMFPNEKVVAEELSKVALKSVSPR